MEVFFDLDGTLTDPSAGITRCVQHALRELGRTVPAKHELLWCIGPPLASSFEQLLKDAAGTAPSEAEVAEAVRIYRERFSAVGLFENELIAGIPECLRGLRERAEGVHVASSKPLVFVRRIIEHFGLTAAFDGLYGAELDGTRAEKGELLAHALSHAGADPARAIMVGDRSHDVIGAKQNGMRAVGVLWGFGGRDELTRAGADHQLETVPALSAWLARA